MEDWRMEFVDKCYERVDRFEVVDEFPLGYIVWNIGRANFPHEEYIPLVKPDPNHKHWVLMKDMKALKCSSEEEALYILKRASRGDYERKHNEDGINVDIFNQLVKEYESDRKKQAPGV